MIKLTRQLIATAIIGIIFVLIQNRILLCPSHPLPSLFINTQNSYIWGNRTVHSVPQVQNPCLISVSKCLTAIEDLIGTKAKLVSFSKDVILTKQHQETDKIFCVPNVVHYVRFNKGYFFKFASYTSYKSVEKFLDPMLILVWGDYIPDNKSVWWNRTVKEVANIYHIYVPKLPSYSNKTFHYVAPHMSDILRIKILKAFGGIYLDDDTIVVKSFDDMRVYDTALGRIIQGESLANSVIVAKQNAEFLNIWLEAYGTFYPDCWNCNSVLTAWKLYELFPHLIHVENESFTEPYNRIKMHHMGHEYDFSNNYAVHISYEGTQYIPTSDRELWGYNCTLGSVMRYVLYGSVALKDTVNVSDGKSHMSQ